MALYNKYRPVKFEDLCGQEYVKKILSHQVKENKLSNAYLFTGPAGTGKTTVARIFSSMINSSSGITLEPDILDHNVQIIMSGKSDIDVIEFDAASSRGIDEIKAIREKSYFAPISMRKKIWIIDECHQLTSAAWEALLKILEEPPSHSMFILCTTEPSKISETILTRCMALKFTSITNQDIYAYLKKIIVQEQIDIEEEAVRLIAKSSKGSMRQAISNLEKVMNLGSKIDAQMVTQCIGIMSVKLARDFIISIFQNKFTDGLSASTQAMSSGVSASDFLEEVGVYLHHMAMIRYKVLQSMGLTDMETKEVEGAYDILRQESTKFIKEDVFPKVALVAILGMINAINKSREMRIYNVQSQYLVDIAWVQSLRAFRMQLVQK